MNGKEGDSWNKRREEKNKKKPYTKTYYIPVKHTQCDFLPFLIWVFLLSSRSRCQKSRHCIYIYIHTRMNTQCQCLVIRFSIEFNSRAAFALCSLLLALPLCGTVSLGVCLWMRLYIAVAHALLLCMFVWVYVWYFVVLVCDSVHADEFFFAAIGHSLQCDNCCWDLLHFAATLHPFESYNVTLSLSYVMDHIQNRIKHFSCKIKTHISSFMTFTIQLRLKSHAIR